MNKLSVCMVTACLLLASPSYSSQVYRWVDDKGATHFGENVPPRYQDRAQEIDTELKNITEKPPVLSKKPKKAPPKNTARPAPNKQLPQNVQPPQALNDEQAEPEPKNLEEALIECKNRVLVTVKKRTECLRAAHERYGSN